MFKKVRIKRISNTGGFFTNTQQLHFAVGTIHNITGLYANRVQLDCCCELAWAEDEIEEVL